MIDLQQPQAVIFDFDGTLVDSEPIHGLGTREGLATVGIDLSLEEFFARWVGLPDVQCFEQVAADRGLTLGHDALQRVWRTKNAVYERMALAGEVPLVPGAATVVRDLAARVPVGVCSAARRVEIEASLARNGLLETMRAIVGVEDVSRSKPDPEGYLLAARRLGAEPRLCVAVEDTPRGIEAARGAGMAVIGVAQTLPPERLHAASLVCARLAEIDMATLARALATGRAEAR